MSTLPQSEWLTTDEAAQYLKVKPRSLLLWTRQGKIKAYVLSGTKRRIWSIAVRILTLWDRSQG